jgi:photosystem II stability/assembly factor-like uncharacterized protein
MRNLTILFIGLFSFTISFAQTKITSATFGMMEARWLGPGTMSGRITAIEGVNEDGKTIYVGSAGGGVWKTTNAGASFTPIFDKYCQSIGAIGIDQKNPKIVFVGTGESNMRNSVSIGNGLYKSEDAGENWTRIGLDSTEHIAKIVIDPHNSNIIYVAAPGPLWSESSHRGLFKSVDGGKSWEKILYINEKAGCADISLDPSNPLIVYATTWEFRRLPYLFNSGGQGSGVYKSMDGGKSWKELTNGLPSKPFGRVALALAPSAPNNLLAIVESKETGLFISQDGGEHWKQQSATSNITARPFYFSVIQVDPVDAKRVYRPAFTFDYSDDGGFSFTNASSDGSAVHSDEHALWINPKNTSQLYLGTDGGVYLSLDRGATWIFLQNLPVGQFYHVSVDNATPYHIYGGLQDNGTWMAPSSAPGGVGNSSWQTIYGGDGFWAQPDPSDPEIAFAESQGGSAGRINLKTFKAVSIQPQAGREEEKLRWNWNTPIVTGAHNLRNLYMGAQYLYRSTDQGSNWARISPDLTTNDKKKQEQENSGGLSADNTSAENHCTIFTIAESPLDENTIWAGTDDGNLQLTTSGGKEWTNLSANYAKAGIPAQTWISSIEPSLFDSNLVYITLDNHMYGDHKTWLAKSADKGITWTQITSPEFTGFAHKIKEDIVNRDLLFLGTEMGLFATVDDGKNWFRMKNHIPDYTLVRDIKIHPVTNDLLLATHGRGIIVVDDISAMRSLKQDIIAKDVYLFESKPYVLTTGKYAAGDFSDGATWNGGNPASVQPISYYLKDRVSSEDVKIEIYDDSGKLVKSLPASKRKGINKVYWDLRMTAPKVAGGGTKTDFSGFTAPMVMPGNYTVKLKLGKKEYTQAITLIHDSANVHFSLKDRQAQYATAMALYHLHEDLARTVEDISDNQKILTENILKIKGPKGKKLLEEYNGKLEELRSSLLATKQKSIFADEQRLRERISDVYVAVCMQEAAPSNLQAQRVEVLRQEWRKADETNALLKAKYQDKVKKELIKEGLLKDTKSSMKSDKGN